jgi:exosome complex component CSL4
MEVLPGTLLSKSDLLTGPGAFIRDGHVYASLAGVRNDKGQTREFGLPVVINPKSVNSIPAVHSTVICRITKISTPLAHAEILVVDGIPTKQNFKAIIRRQDVRSIDKDKVQMQDSFRPGDIVRAEVISLGDSQSYHISTAKNELGVIFAKSISGGSMYPVSWREMRCSITNHAELRKCAKP